MELKVNTNQHFIMMVGVAGAGKSTYAEDHARFLRQELEREVVILSSDALREEMYGDASIQVGTDKVFTEMHNRTINSLAQGYDVIYDATNLQRKYRTPLIHDVKEIAPDCQLICIVVDTPLGECLARNQKRDRHVPEYVIKRQFHQKEDPTYDEGWNTIMWKIPEEQSRCGKC